MDSLLPVFRKRGILYTVLKTHALQEDCSMIEATSCGGVVIHRGKILALYKSYKNRYEGWVLPKGTVEPGETHEQTALREVKEEADVRASIVKYILVLTHILSGFWYYLIRLFGRLWLLLFLELSHSVQIH